ncbi:hypothetical protein G9U51_08225 [Calidifontibacter sp. DB0510]|uniref:Peptidoglycan binding domain-containing protein n=1 Tax=Metallococcus carri TaxID=1656884 RepID=A0A967AZ46_9MICO|nr:putative peptidoglycan-binding domain-containing protein [Metallococcus carri]NHN55754.1 hypothetical protein [Metallococcus carri]NHN55761.1 hypothetical protein [Metallococcus carri]NOP38550.1 hypothetical protein [Calidifontibacter sp. DB2511S]NOP38557.1 hypothetical protein [Calidifontibacter sp. DB2511S]
MTYRSIATSQPQVTHETIRSLFVERVFVPAAGKAALVYEDGVYDPVDYGKHVDQTAAGYQKTWHTELAQWFGQTVAFAADLNWTGAGSERDWFYANIVPKLKHWGLGFHWETNHLHIDVGQYSNDGARWYRGGWEGKPAWDRSSVIACDGVWGYSTTRSLQKLLKVAQTGSFDRATIVALQKWLIARGARVKADGIVGPATKAAMQAALGTSSPWGSTWFTTVLQVRLNATHWNGRGKL